MLLSVSVISHIGKIFKLLPRLLPIFTCMHVSVPLILLIMIMIMIYFGYKRQVL